MENKNLNTITSRMKGWQLETFKSLTKIKLMKVFLYLKKPFRKKLITNLFSLNPYRLNEILKLHLTFLFSCKNKKIEKIIHKQQKAKLSRVKNKI